MEKLGEIIQFKVSKNHANHLRGNVYIQFKDQQIAGQAYESLLGRFYAAKQLFPEFVPITKWKNAICGLYEKNRYFLIIN